MPINGRDDQYAIIVDVPHSQWKRRYAIAIEVARKGKLKDFTQLIVRNADLRGISLDGCHVNFADLRGSDLTGASFLKADMTYSDFTGTNLTGVNVKGANIEGLRLTGANLTNSNFPTTPAVPHLDAAILQSLKDEKNFLGMNSWHSPICETTHCRGGWAVVLAGKKALTLEKKIGPETTAALVYWNSTGYIPKFHHSERLAMQDMRLCAKRDPLPM